MLECLMNYKTTELLWNNLIKLFDHCKFINTNKLELLAEAFY